MSGGNARLVFTSDGQTGSPPTFGESNGSPPLLQGTGRGHSVIAPNGDAIGQQFSHTHVTILFKKIKKKVVGPIPELSPRYFNTDCKLKTPRLLLVLSFDSTREIDLDNDNQFNDFCTNT